MIGIHWSICETIYTGTENVIRNYTDQIKMLPVLNLVNPELATIISSIYLLILFLCDIFLF